MPIEKVGQSVLHCLELLHQRVYAPVDAAHKQLAAGAVAA